MDKTQHHATVLHVQAVPSAGKAGLNLSGLGASLTRLMQENPHQDVDILFGPGDHLLQDTFVLGSGQIPARGYRLCLKSQDPQRPAVLKASVPVTGWERVEDSPCVTAPFPEGVVTPPQSVRKRHPHAHCP